MAGTSDCARVLGVLLAGVISGCGPSATAGGNSTGDAGQSGSVATAGSAAGAGASGAGGAVETPYSGWADACGDVTMNGRCVGETFEWCDYFARGLLRLDCAALGMRCRAHERQAYEEERNGCVGGPCTETVGRCDGSIGDGPIAVNCVRGEILANACRRQNGAGSVCTIEGEYQRARCSHATCEDEWTVTCDGTAQVICDEEGAHRIVDCARCRPDGTCSVANPERPDCINYSFDCS